ncbi:uronyl 2-sulfotransferase-like isoform X1 [Leptotrombidium deliense]|uniref:Uronyl 2-sulfotransferase-like isoform X1 n=1 Tax=Leptotrombidium deliense TaxID=299467 RepID=A0A443SF03_9ACAR|nr:uronyl 2-sulfotransferase-like isoform X1 [Leptotrombidium deliense]
MINRKLVILTFCVFLVEIIFYKFLKKVQFNNDNNEFAFASKKNKHTANNDENCINRLYYNRVPKCGSSTLVHLMQTLSKLNGFNHFHSHIYDRRLLNYSEQKEVVKNVTQQALRSSFDRHVFYINFEDFNATKSPIYINLIRDPVERIISSFYYRRAMAMRRMKKFANITKPSDYWLRKNFDRCVKVNDTECTFITGMSYPTLLVPYFCGQHVNCTLLNNPWALSTALNNINKNYKVIGVLEHFEITLSVFEKELNFYFRGTKKLYYNLSKVYKNRNIKKERVSEQTKNILKINLTAEYTLYKFVVQKLFKAFKL